jgi:tetratricopeptide (TPR) repeat protein
VPAALEFPAETVRETKTRMAPRPPQKHLTPAADPLDRLLLDAVERHRAGGLEAAAAGYRRILEARPKHPDALHLLGLVAHQTGDQPRAIELIRRAIAINRRDPTYHGNLAAALLALGRVDDAIISARKALALHPRSAEAHNTLGNALMAKDRPVEAEGCYRRAIVARADWAVAHNNLGAALRRQGRLDAAEAAYRQALATQPAYAAALSNLGRVLHEQARYDAALDCFDGAIAIEPGNVEAHANRGVLLLTLGRFAEGWRDYEWRLKARATPLAAAAPAWDGGALDGSTILLKAEQGLGSAIQFVRYAPLVAARGGRVVLECRRPLFRLFAGLRAGGKPFPCDRHVAGDAPPACDLQAPLMSLPHLLGTDAASIPCDVPYLAAEPAMIDDWRDRLALPGDRPAIGLVWSGNPRHENDRNRSMPAEQFVPLLERCRAHFVSLQIGAREDDLERRAPGRVQRLPGRDLDFADTAAVLALLDGVVSVDTAVAHLAGALGRPCWLLVPFVPEWRWQLDRPDSPWYPSLTLVRQARPGDWPGVIARVTEALGHRFDTAATP